MVRKPVHFQIVVDDREETGLFGCVPDKPGKHPEALLQLAGFPVVQCNSHETVDRGPEFLAGLSMRTDIAVDCRDRAAAAGLRIAPGEQMATFACRFGIGDRRLDGFGIGRVDAFRFDALRNRSRDQFRFWFERGSRFSRKRACRDRQADTNRAEQIGRAICLETEGLRVILAAHGRAATQNS